MSAATTSELKTPEALEREFKGLVSEIEKTAREWGVRNESLEGRFVSALLAATEWLGRLNTASHATLAARLKENQDTAAVELARAREITKAANLALQQTRHAQVGLQVAKENLVVSMIQETLPMFADKLRELLVVKEKSWNDGVRQQRLMMAGLVALGVFLGGYVFRAWQDYAASTALDRCLANPLEAAGHVYCDLMTLRQTSR